MALIEVKCSLMKLCVVKAADSLSSRRFVTSRGPEISASNTSVEEN